MGNCSMMNFCKEFHKNRIDGFICFNPIHYLTKMCDFFKGAGKRVNPQTIHINAEDMEKQMKANKEHKKETKKRIMKKYKRRK